MSDIENLHLYQGQCNIGILPWLESEKINFSLIEDYLQRYEGLNVGEVGLDNRYKNLGIQIEVLKNFTELAFRYKRTMSVHCLKRWGYILEIINSDKYREIPILFHGFNGKIEILNTLLQRVSYFSFSQRDINRTHTISILESIPIDNLLIESDMSEEYFSSIGYETYLSEITSTHKVVANILNIDIKEFVEIINNNYNQFLRSYT